MLFGKIPRFSPSFSPGEAWTSARYLVAGGDDGAKVAEFETEFASFIGARHAVMVPSARYACYLLLKGLGVGEGDEVVLPAFTYFAIPAMVKLLGARAVFADVGLRTHLIDPDALKNAIGPRTKAVIPTHLFGTPCDMDAVLSVARERGVKVVEDCAQSTGARYRNVRAGNLGDASYYTFGLTKNITTLSGAMVTTSDDALASFLRDETKEGGRASWAKSAKEACVGTAMWFATHPWLYWATTHPAIVLGNAMGKDPIHERFGEREVVYDALPASFKNSRPRAVQAAVGLAQLARIEALNGARRANGQRLDAGLADVKGLTVPEYPDGAEPIYMSFVVHHARRDDLMKSLRSRGVDTTVGYMSDLSDHPLFLDWKAECPNAHRIRAELLHVPVHPNLTEGDVDHMIASVKAACLEFGGS
jgi:dTDP-4-amino-4,6-dideoxygalactose transaminase